MANSLYTSSFAQNKTQRLNISSTKRSFSDEVTPPVIENLVPQSTGFTSRAIRDVASGKYKNLPISYKKLSIICRLIRGLSVREAINQLLLSQSRKAVYVRRGLRTIANYAVNTYNMNRDRLVIDEVLALRGMAYKRLDIKGRGRTAVLHRRHSHFLIKLKEQPYRMGEVRIGRFGRTIKTWKKVDRVSDAWKEKQAMM
jgi:large subunit ribosomal protein L22